jgi:5-methylcytosine-specific restriction protein B
MIQADQIRQFAFDNCVAPARAARRIEVVIRAGDVHREMSLANAMPAVCSALGGRKFEEFAGVTIVERSGPLMGANMRFRISLTAAPSSKAGFRAQASSS